MGPYNHHHFQAMKTKITLIEKDTEEFTEPLEIGQCFKHISDQVYIIAEVGRKEYALISLNGGSRWTSPCKILEATFGVSAKEFTFIPKLTITISQ